MVTLYYAKVSKLEAPDLLVLRYHLATLKGDKEQMNQVVALAKGKHGAERWVADAEALALARAGRLQAARLSSDRAMDLALQEGQRETAASYRAARAVWEAVYGNAAEGNRSATEALAGCGKRVLNPLKSTSVERRINNLHRLVSAGKGFFRNLLLR
jgi:hypothetical protein